MAAVGRRIGDAAGARGGAADLGERQRQSGGPVADMFVAGRASILALRNGGVSTDDMWFQLGNSAVDLKLGRFEAADLFPIPRDAYIPYANDGAVPAGAVFGGQLYRGQVLRGRLGNNQFHGALTFNAGNGLSAELGVVESDKSVAGQKGIRPVVTYMAGPLMLRAGFESFSDFQTSGNTKKASGYGLVGAYDLGGITLRGNYASAKLKYLDNRKSTSYALIVDTAMGFAAGYIASEDSGGTNSVALGKFKTSTLYAAYTMPLFDIKGASMTTAIATSDGGGSNNAEKINGVKVRFNYAF